MLRMLALLLGLAAIAVLLWFARGTPAAATQPAPATPASPSQSAAPAGVDLRPAVVEANRVAASWDSELTSDAELAPVPSVTLIAQVCDSNGITPAANVRVVLEPDVGNDEPRMPRASLARRKEMRVLNSAADGRARFESVTPGRYALRAELSPILFTELDALQLSEQTTVREVSLVLPAYGILAGQFLGLEGRSLEGFSIVVVPDGASAEESLDARGRIDPAGARPLHPIAADGTFRTGPLRTGRSTVSLGYPAVQQGFEFVGFGWGGSSLAWGELVPLGEIEVSGGSRSWLDFDLTDRLPGRIAVELHVHGRPAGKCHLWVVPEGERPSNSVLELDGDGRGVSGPIPPGTVRLDISGPGERWSWRPDKAWRVHGGETIEITLDAPIVEGSLQLVDSASGEAIADSEVLIGPADDVGDGRFVRTTEEGRISLALAPCRCRIAFPREGVAPGGDSRSPYEPVTFEWSELTASALRLEFARKR